MYPIADLKTLAQEEEFHRDFLTLAHRLLVSDATRDVGQVSPMTRLSQDTPGVILRILHLDPYVDMERLDEETMLLLSTLTQRVHALHAANLGREGRTRKPLRQTRQRLPEPGT